MSIKLYELPRETMFSLDGETYFFDHVDGMYSLCYDKDKNIVHLAAWTDVEPIKDTSNAN